MKIFFAFICFAFNCNGTIKSQPQREEGAKVCREIVLENTSKTVVSFHYNDQFQDLVQIKLKGGEKYTLLSERPILLKQSNLTQNFYLLYPCDVLKISINKLGNAILETGIDSIRRNNELALTVSMHEGTPINFWKLNEMRGKYLDNDYQKYEEFITKDFQDKRNFIEKFSLQHTMSSSFRQFIDRYLEVNLREQEAFILLYSKAKLNGDFVKRVEKDAWKNKQIFEQDSLLASFFWPLTYPSIKFRSISKSLLYTDSLYQFAKDSLKGYVREKSIFLCAKDEIFLRKRKDSLLIEDYLKTSGNNMFKTYIKDNYSIDLVDKSTAENIILIDKNGAKHIFKNLLKKYKDTVLYLDFWASWCAPCRMEMPRSRDLRKKYLDKPIKFIYISQDENLVKWKMASEADGISDEENFLLQNAGKSILLKELKISTIPRYIIIGKDGKVVNTNAPRPSDPQLVSRLNELLN